MSIKKQREIIELAHKYKLEEIRLEEESKLRLLEFEKNCKLEVERIRFDIEKSIIRFKRASIKHTQEERFARS